METASTCKAIFFKAVSLLLIAIFTFAITPVSFLHNVLANHVDTRINHDHKKSNEIAKAGFDCHSKNFVAERTFLPALIKANLEKAVSFTPFSGNYKRSFYSKHHFFAELRGPPLTV